MIIIPGADITLDSTNVTEDEQPDWDSNTTYSAGDRVIYVGKEPHRIYEALESTTGDVPPDNPSQWALVSSTNRWAMFDERTSTVTERDTSIEVTVSVSGKADKVALFGLQADTVRLVAKDGNTTVGDKTYQTEGDSVLVAPLPGLFLDLSVEITISASTAKTSQLVIGLSQDIGAAQFGYNSGIRDFSKVETNDFGTTRLTRRNFARTLEVNTLIRKRAVFSVDKVRRVLEDNRARPVAWDAAEDATGRDRIRLFGFYRDFTLQHNNVALASLSIDIEGMT